MDLNALPYEVLHCVLKKGYLEDIVSKERVSKRFQSIVSEVLFSKTIFEMQPQCQYYDIFPEYVRRAIKRMPNIRSDRDGNLGSKAWNDGNAIIFADHLRKMVKFSSNSHASRYIEAMKKLDPAYTAEDIQHVFWENDLFDEQVDATRLMGKYPDLKLKIRYRRGNFEPRFHPSLYYEINVHRIKYPLTSVYENMSEVTIDTDYENISVLKMFPNMKTLNIHAKNKGGKRGDLSKYAPYIGHNVRELSLSGELKSEDMTILCNPSLNRSIKSIKTGLSGLPQLNDEILRFIIDSKRIKIKQLDIFWLKIKRRTLEVHNDEIIEKRDLIRDVLIRFPTMKRIKILHRFVVKPEESLCRRICDDVELINRKRRIIIITSTFPMLCCGTSPPR